MEGDFMGFLGHILDLLMNIALIFAPIIRGITALAQWGASGAGADKEQTDKIGNAGKGAAAGAVIGSVVPGVGTLAGAVIGGGIGYFMAEGGIVEGPMNAVIGEAGPEAVIPLAKLPAMVQEMSGGNSGSGSITINGGIHIGEGNNLSKRDVRVAIEGALPAILQRANASGARGAI